MRDEIIFNVFTISTNAYGYTKIAGNEVAETRQ